MKRKDFDNLLQTVEFELTQRQRFLLFEELYTKYSFLDILKTNQCALISVSTIQINKKLSVTINLTNE
jgi:hypothetical protein